MMISLPDALEKELLRVAVQSKRPLQAVVEEAVRHYLDGLAITDVEPADVSAAQMTLAEELPDPSARNQSARTGTLGCVASGAESDG